MNTKNNLHNALNKAFENHTEPLNEAQWNRLEGAILRKKKRRFFPFFMLLGLISLTAGITYLLTLNYGVKNTPVASYSTKHTTIVENNSISPKTQVENSTESTVSTTNNVSSYSTHSAKTNSYKRTTGINKNTNSSKNTNSNTNINEPDQIETNQTTTGPTPIIAKNENDIDNPIKEDKFEVTPAPEPEKEKEVTKVEILKTNDTIYTAIKTDDGKKDVPPAVLSKFAFSFAGGYSKMNVKVSGLENSEQLHKDTRKIFEESNKDLHSQFLNLGFDWNILPRYKIGISTGIQYLRVASIVNIDYTMTEVPFWDYRHTQIIGYADKNPGIEFKANNTNYTTYIIIPVKVNYTIPVTRKSEIVISPGLNLTTLVSAKGQNLSINKEQTTEPGVRPLKKDNYRTFNPGFAGGMQYNFNIKETWWIGAEGVWQTSPMKYKTGYGSVKSNLQGYMVNLIIKYKI